MNTKVSLLESSPSYVPGRYHSVIKLDLAWLFAANLSRSVAMVGHYSPDSPSPMNHNQAFGVLLEPMMSPHFPSHHKYFPNQLSFSLARRVTIGDTVVSCMDVYGTPRALPGGGSSWPRFTDQSC